MPNLPQKATIARINHYIDTFSRKAGIGVQPDDEVKQAVVLGLANNLESLGRPLCPCNFYANKAEEAKARRWRCPCDEMQIYKYCHCMLYVGPDGMPVTEYLPENHEGRVNYGLHQDPQPDKGRTFRHHSTAAIEAWHKR